MQLPNNSTKNKQLLHDPKGQLTSHLDEYITAYRNSQIITYTLSNLNSAPSLCLHLNFFLPTSTPSSPQLQMPGHLHQTLQSEDFMNTFPSLSSIPHHHPQYTAYIGSFTLDNDHVGTLLLHFLLWSELQSLLHLFTIHAILLPFFLLSFVPLISPSWLKQLCLPYEGFWGWFTSSLAHNSPIRKPFQTLYPKPNSLQHNTYKHLIYKLWNPTYIKLWVFFTSMLLNFPVNLLV